MQCSSLSLSLALSSCNQCYNRICARLISQRHKRVKTSQIVLPFCGNYVKDARADHLGFAVLQCISKSYFLANLTVKKIYPWARSIKIAYFVSYSLNISWNIWPICNIKYRAGHFRYFLLFSIIKNYFLHFLSN